MSFDQLKIPLRIPLKFPLDMISRSKNITDAPVAAICIHIVCTDLVQLSPQRSLRYFFSISYALVVLVTEVVVVVIVVIVLEEAEAAVVVVVVASKYCLFS